MKPHLQRGVFQGTSPCIYTKRSVNKKNSVSDETHKLSKTDSTVFTFWTNPTENASAFQQSSSHGAIPTFSDQGGESGGVHQRTHSYDFWWQMWQGMDG
jgi:hypothetical protein